MLYRIETRSDAREVYVVIADSQEAAIARITSGDVEPSVSEIDGMEIVSVEPDCVECEAG